MTIYVEGKSKNITVFFDGTTLNAGSKLNGKEEEEKIARCGGVSHTLQI